MKGRSSAGLKNWKTQASASWDSASWGASSLSTAILNMLNPEETMIIIAELYPLIPAIVNDYYDLNRVFFMLTESDKKRG